METFLHVAGVIASLAAIAAPSAAALGLAPRLGPMRAIVLALSTRFTRAQDVSQRTTELRILRSMLSTVQRDQYVVVSGPKGVGKSCMVDTALQYTFGVVVLRVPAGTSEEKILADAFKAITRSSTSFLDHSASARRVLWWHHFLFRQPATVVLRAAERKPTQQFADLDSSARALTHDFGARVLIDASVNSLPDAATATKREKVLELEPMQRELLQKLPELQLLHEALKSASLADVVWMCVGGNPADYKGLLGAWNDWQRHEALKSAKPAVAVWMWVVGNPTDYRCLFGAWNDQQRQTIEQVVALFVQELIGKALDNVSSSVASDKRLRALFDKFLECSEVSSSTLMGMELVRPSPDKVLRVVKLRSSSGSRGGGQRILIPADAATALVLCTGITGTPSMEELKALAMPVKEVR